MLSGWSNCEDRLWDRARDVTRGAARIGSGDLANVSDAKRPSSESQCIDNLPKNRVPLDRESSEFLNLLEAIEKNANDMKKPICPHGHATETAETRRRQKLN